MYAQQLSHIWRLQPILCIVYSLRQKEEKRVGNGEKKQILG